MAGSAMFTTVLSSMTMKSAKHIAPRVHHLRLSSVIAGTSVLPLRSSTPVKRCPRLPGRPGSGRGAVRPYDLRRTANVTSGGASFGRLEHPPERLAHLLELLRGERAEQLPHLLREGRQPVDQPAAGVGEADPHHPAVALVALAADMAGALEPVDDPGDRRREHVAFAAEVAGREPAAGAVQHVQRERLRDGHALFLDERAGGPLGLGADVVQELSDLRGQSGLPGHRSCSHDSRRILSQKNLSHTKYSDANELAQVDREDRYEGLRGGG